MTQTVIIGGGPAGMAAAIAAARRGEETLLVERLDRVGKKLLATGNGRCNLMNRSAPAYPGGEAFARQVLARCGEKELEAFFRSLGLRLRTEDMGRVYPASGQAASVLDALRMALAREGVSLRVSCPVRRLEKRGERLLLSLPEETLRAARVIVTGGGKAQPKLGSDGSCYALLTGMGHTLRRPFPALTQIETDTAPLRGLSGIRVKAEAWVTQKGCEVHRTQGEALFADYGLSGVCIMQLARFAQGREACLHLNLLPALGLESAEECGAELAERRSRWSNAPLEQLFTGLCVTRLGAALLRNAGIGPLSRSVASLRDAEIQALTAFIADFTLPVRGVKGFDSAQVTAGGIPWEEFSPDNLASRLCPGLYAAGEVLDVDGDCGGFNLMFAFASGILAGSDGYLEEVLS